MIWDQARVSLLTAFDRILNEKRLRDYPRLALLAMGCVFLFNILGRQGWLGALGQIIAHDFITAYGAGIIFRTDPARLYDFATQYTLQSRLVAPTELPGLAPFINPPYVALAYVPWTRLSLPLAYAVWTCLMLGAVGVAVLLMVRFLATGELRGKGLTIGGLLAVIVSSFAFVEGLVAGQNHGLTLLLMVVACIATLKGRWWLGGLAAGLMIYKPQLTVGLVLTWVFLGEMQPIVGFALSGAMWSGLGLLLGGIEPYIAYFGFGDQLMGLPFTEGPAYIMATPYGFLATVIGEEHLRVVYSLTAAVSVAATIGFARVAWRSRRRDPSQRGTVMALAILYPLVATPYTLLHDMILLAPVLILLAREPHRGRTLVYWAVVSYVGVLFLTLLGQATGVAVIALIPFVLFWAQLRNAWRADAEDNGVP